MNQSGQTPSGEMPLIAHLLELRTRLMRSIGAVLLVFAALFAFANPIYIYISAPLLDQLPQGAQMIATDVTAPFFTPFKLTFVLSFFVAIPVVLFQIWGFIAPGLYEHEKKMVYPLLISSTLLFYLGIVFCYFVVLPIVIGFFTSTGPETITIMTDISKYLDFVLKLFFAFGVAFEIPIATVLLVWSGITSRQSLIEKRPYVIVAAFVVGMLLTPPDVISQTLLAVPMLLLFELGVIFSRYFESPDDQNEIDEQNE